MKIQPINYNSYAFQSAPKDENPITKGGERALLIKGTFVAGLGLGARLLFELMDDSFVFDKLGNKAEHINNKINKGISPTKKVISGVGIWAGLVMIAIGAFATLYTLLNAPKINYKAKVNSFQKGKEMDVYIKGNEAEKELYTQMNENAKNADSDEKEKLKMQYAQMQMAKNKVPDFIKLKK